MKIKVYMGLIKKLWGQPVPQFNYVYNRHCWLAHNYLMDVVILVLKKSSFYFLNVYWIT